MYLIPIKYRKTIPSIYDSIDNQSILNHINSDLKRGGVTKLVMKSECILEFRNAFFAIRPWLNWNIWNGVRGGKFEIKTERGIRRIVYQFDTSLVLILGFLIGVFCGIISQLIWIGVIAFVLLGLLNWIIMLIEQKVKLRNLIKSIKINGL